MPEYTGVPRFIKIIMNYLFCDIDGTLIYSHRRKPDCATICVEKLNGKEQSFVTENTYNFFKNQKFLNIVALTTRSFEQYKRIAPFLFDIGINDVLILNGALYLRNGNIVKEWTDSVLNVIKDAGNALENAYLLAVKTAGIQNTVYCAPYLFYIKTTDARNIKEKFLNALDINKLTAASQGSKLYCFPKTLNKGCALNRYRVKYVSDESRVAAAGDSEFDIPMLKAADISLCPDGLFGEFKKNSGKISCGGIFSDSFVSVINEMRSDLN